MPVFGGTSEFVLQYHSITIHIENAGGSDIDLSLLSLKSTTQIFAGEPFFGFIFFVDSNKYRIFVAEKTIERN